MLLSLMPYKQLGFMQLNQAHSQLCYYTFRFITVCLNAFNPKLDYNMFVSALNFFLLNIIFILPFYKMHTYVLVNVFT